MKMDSKSKYSIISVFILIVVVALALVTMFTSDREIKKWQAASILGAIDQRIGTVPVTASDFLKNRAKDMLFLRSLLEEEGPRVSWSETSIRKLIENNDVYEELYLINQDGSCATGTGIDFDKSVRDCRIPQAVLDIFNSTRFLSKNEVFMSALTKYKDFIVIFYATAIKDGKGIVAVVSADSFLEEIRRLSRPDEQVFLLREDGMYLAHEARSKEIFSDSTDNFHSDFPMIGEGALNDYFMNRLEANNLIFSFWRIDPAESAFAVHQGVQKVRGEGGSAVGKWILVAVSGKMR